MKIFYLLGPSASGKDTIYNELLKAIEILKPIVPWSTRPMREGEVDGVTYNFTTNEEFYKMKENNQIIEYRSYDTVHGEWIYFTPIIEPDDDIHNIYLSIGTLESYLKMKEYYGNDIVPIYIVVRDKIRLERSITRESLESNPNYEEVCRRFLSDKKDFSSENLKKCEINFYNTFKNEDTIDNCVSKIKRFIFFSLKEWDLL
jgi:guanylate kinase